MTRTSSSSVNAGYPAPGYQGQGQPPQTGYPGQNTGYPAGGYQPGYQNGQYGNYYGAYQPNGGYSNPQNYPGYQNPPPPPIKKPSISDQLTNFAKNIAQQVLTQTLINKVSGRT